MLELGKVKDLAGLQAVHMCYSALGPDQYLLGGP